MLYSQVRIMTTKTGGDKYHLKLSLSTLYPNGFVSFYRDHFGSKHPKYSDTLLDYGFYLLNVDNICQSVAIYQVC